MLNCRRPLFGHRHVTAPAKLQLHGPLGAMIPAELDASRHPGVRLRRDPRLLTSTLSAWETML